MNQAAGRLALFARVASDRRLRRLVASYGVYSVAEQATWLAITVYAFNRGGIGEAGLVAFIQLAPAIVLSPLLSAAGDQYRTDVVLAAGYAAQAISMLATAAAMSMGAGPIIVYGAATMAAVCITLSRPAMGALLPAATPTPTHLAAARVCLGIIDNLGVLVGPTIAGLLLVSGDGPERVFVTMGALMVVATVLVSGLGFPRANVVRAVDQTAGDVWRETLGGFAALRGDRDLRLVVAIATLGGVIVGATDVLFVTVAEDLLDGSASKAGLFGAAFGLGALLGAVGSVSLILRSGLIVPLALAVAVGGVVIASMSAMSTVMLVAVAFVACGAAASLADIAGASLVPRFAPAGVLSRVYGVLEGSRMAAVAFGSVAVSVVAEWLGLRLALVFVGLALPALLAPYASRLRHLDRATPPPDPALLQLLTGSPIFAHLPPSTLEQLLAGLESRHVGSGVEMIHQGDHGDEYFLIADGEVVVAVDGVKARVQGPGSGFGEIALVRDVPRTATVTTSTPATLYSVRRADFLAALTGTPTALRAADDHAQRHLDDDTTRRAVPLSPMPYRAGGATGETGGTDAMRKQKDQRLDTIAAISLFQTSSKAQLKWLVPILTPVGVSAGTVLCTEGEPGRACYVVVAGEAKVAIGGDDIDTIGPGGFFGEMALLDGGPRVATVTAITDMELLEMTRADFISVITEVPAIARNMLVAVGERLRVAHAQLHTGHVGIWLSHRHGRRLPTDGA